MSLPLCHFFSKTSGYVRATDMCLESNNLKIIRLHRTTTKKYYFLRDGITQQRETEEFYDLQRIKDLSTSSISFFLPYRRSTKARANSIAVSRPRLYTLGIGALRIHRLTHTSKLKNKHC